MPSPREILLSRHRAVEPRLDALRATVLAEALASDTSQSDMGRGLISPLDGLRTLWRELILPCRSAWAALAAVWIVLLACNAALRRDADRDTISRVELAAMLAGWRDQQRLLTELAASPGITPAAVAKPSENDAPGHTGLAPATSLFRRSC
jgi:hypothetical protein